MKALLALLALALCAGSGAQEVARAIGSACGARPSACGAPSTVTCSLQLARIERAELQRHLERLSLTETALFVIVAPADASVLTWLPTVPKSTQSPRSTP